jgi:hypothetical protein
VATSEAGILRRQQREAAERLPEVQMQKVAAKEQPASRERDQKLMDLLRRAHRNENPSAQEKLTARLLESKKSQVRISSPRRLVVSMSCPCRGCREGLKRCGSCGSSGKLPMDTNGR